MATEKKIWKPKVGGKFYRIAGGHVGAGVKKEIWDGSAANESLYAKGNCFRFKKEAEFMYRSFGKMF